MSLRYKIKKLLIMLFIRVTIILQEFYLNFRLRYTIQVKIFKSVILNLQIYL